MPIGIALVILATVYRIAAVYDASLLNFSPLMALTFCGAVYFQNRKLWAVPFLALLLSDLWLDHHYAAMGYNREWSGVAGKLFCFVLSMGFGWLVSLRKSWLNLFSGALGGSLFFYLVTNSISWLMHPFYEKSVTGWWQAMTVGYPEFPPTLFFFRNTIVSDLLFTGLFALTMEFAALRASRPSLLPVKVEIARSN